MRSDGKVYIDADKFAEEICNFPAIDEDSANAVISLLHRQPTADFVEVPCRCSKCEHLEIINKEPVYAECKKQKLAFLLWQADTREHFCSYGERREE